MSLWAGIDTAAGNLIWKVNSLHLIHGISDCSGFNSEIATCPKTIHLYPSQKSHRRFI